MITQDVSNIMRIVKGIIIKWSINDNKAKRRANLIISNHVSIISIDYEVKSEILNIILNLEMNKNINKDRVSDELYKLVDRK